MASRYENRTLNRDNPVSSGPAAVSKLGNFGSLHVTLVHSDI